MAVPETGSDKPAQQAAQVRDKQQSGKKKENNSCRHAIAYFLPPEDTPCNE